MVDPEVCGFVVELMEPVPVIAVVVGSETGGNGVTGELEIIPVDEDEVVVELVSSTESEEELSWPLPSEAGVDPGSWVVVKVAAELSFIDGASVVKSGDSTIRGVELSPPLIDGGCVVSVIDSGVDVADKVDVELLPPLIPGDTDDDVESRVTLAPVVVDVIFIAAIVDVTGG